jgi:hypothetical protein
MSESMAVLPGQTWSIVASDYSRGLGANSVTVIRDELSLALPMLKKTDR